MRKSSCKHGQTVRHDDLIFFHNFHKAHHDFCHINFSQIHRSILGQKIADVIIETALIRLLPELAKSHDNILNLSYIRGCNPFNRPSDQFTISFRKSAHHPHINPDNFSIPYLYIARMGISMEKSIIHNLFDIVIHQLHSDFFQIVALFQKPLFIINAAAINLFHNKNCMIRILIIQLRYSHKGYFFIPLCKFFHICRFREKIHLFSRHIPQFVQHHIKIHHIFDAHWRKQLYRPVKKPDITRHHFIDSFALNLYHNRLSGFKAGAMNLRNRC